MYLWTPWDNMTSEVRNTDKVPKRKRNPAHKSHSCVVVINCAVYDEKTEERTRLETPEEAGQLCTRGAGDRRQHQEVHRHWMLGLTLALRGSSQGDWVPLTTLGSLFGLVSPVEIVLLKTLLFVGLKWLLVVQSFKIQHPPVSWNLFSVYFLDRSYFFLSILLLFFNFLWGFSSSSVIVSQVLGLAPFLSCKYWNPILQNIYLTVENAPVLHDLTLCLLEYVSA